MFPDSVIPIPQSGVTAHGLIVSAAEAKHRDEKMVVSFALGLTPALQKELETRVDKGETISAQELKTKYAVDPASADALDSHHHIRHGSSLTGRGEPWRAYGAGNAGGPDLHGGF
jgi:kumamolisin